MATLLDWKKALENTDGSEELLIELAGVFVEECPEMMRQIRAAIDRRDAPALQRTAHSLKGSARIFAAAAVSEAALWLETMGADGDLSGAGDGWTTLAHEVERLMAALGERIDRQNP